MSNLPWKRPNFGRWENLLARDPFFNFDRTLSNMFDNFLEATPRTGERGVVAGAFVPVVDMRDGEQEICLNAELPGMDEKDIHLTVNNDSITIQGEKRFEKKGGDKDRHYVERTYGSFQRTLPLPCEVDKERAEATFKKGVLEVRLPKTSTAKSQARQIPIKA